MAEQQLTYESMLELIRENSQESSREIQEMRRLMQERDAAFDKIRQDLTRQMKATDDKISKLGSRIGDIVEHMLGAKILDKFQDLGYAVEDYTRNHSIRVSNV